MPSEFDFRALPLPQPIRRQKFRSCQVQLLVLFCSRHSDTPLLSGICSELYMEKYCGHERIDLDILADLHVFGPQITKKWLLECRLWFWMYVRLT
jgi:hypothetical protein